MGMAKVGDLVKARDSEGIFLYGVINKEFEGDLWGFFTKDKKGTVYDEPFKRKSDGGRCTYFGSGRLTVLVPEEML